MTQPLEFWIGYGSTYSYLSVMRIDALTEGAGVPLVWKPFNIRALMIEKGLPTGPFVPRPEKLAYMWRDLERRAQRRGLPYAKPPLYPVDTQATVRVALLAAEEGWCSEFSRRVFHMNFAEGRAMGVPGNLEAALRDIVRDAAATIARAHEPDIESALAAQTRTAIDIGVFGSPTFRVGEELFWGDDRLEDALEWARTGRLSVRESV
ncbi:MAG TPA: 2-hydroxychromene-2-carboxylate isomerase [Candidatus Margulisiibacteriota bacterium]|nr:2-hydroxychromene-2-carboxylate isomerase [Candidatus Margulisiibacteriota bacterium]